MIHSTLVYTIKIALQCSNSKLIRQMCVVQDKDKASELIIKIDDNFCGFNETTNITCLILSQN